MGTEMAEDEAEVEALLEQIALAKRKELRLRVEKKRIRDELEQLQAGTLWSREEQTQKQLQDVRRAKEQLEAQKKTEEEKLAKLSGNLKEQELKFRKGMNTKASPFQHAAASVVTSSPQPSENLNQKENLTNVHAQTAANNTASGLPDTKSSPSPPPPRSRGSAPIPSSNQYASTQEVDALQHLIRNINCDEQQKRIEKLQAELQKANSRRQDADFDVPSVKVARRSAESLAANLYGQDEFPANILPPGSKSLDDRQTMAVRKAVNKFIHLKPLDGSHSSHPQGAESPPAKLAHPVENVPATPLTQPTMPHGAPSPAYPQQFVLPGYPQNYPAPTAPIASYPMFSPPMMPINPYGMGFPSPYFPGCGYPAVSSWLPQCAPYPYQVGNTPPPEHLSNPALHQQEEEIRRLERELEMQRITSEQQAESKEFDRLQSRLKELQSKISTLAVEDKPLADSTDEITADVKDDLVLKTLKRQHLESLVKVRNERDLLEEQEKLEELKEQIQRRREEKKRELDHEDWVAKQKRELVALRLQRAIQNNEAKRGGAELDLQNESKEPYNLDSGFALFWDFATGVPAAANDLQITYAVFEGKIIRTPFKVVTPKETKALGPQHKLCSFLSSRHVKKIAATSDLRVIVEVASVAQSGSGGSRIPTSLGWTAFDVFGLTNEGDLNLATGAFQLPVKQSAMPDPSKILVTPPPIGKCGDIRLHIRLVHGERVEEASRVLVDPELHAARYQLPDSGKTLLRPQSKGTQARRASIPGRRTPNDRPTAAKLLDDQKATSPPGSVERLADPPLPAFPQKQDFLDVDRLRLLSATSSRPPSTRPRSNMPPTGDRSRLPPFREDSDAEADEPWIRVDKTIELQRLLLGGNPFLPGDGFNVQIDGGRGFPDNVTISKVTVAALHADRTQVITEDGSVFAPAASDAFNPVFDAYVEYRQSNFNPTLTLVIRVDTIELVSKRPVILGYTVFPVFLDVETRDQPNRPSIPQFILNEGRFQLPLHTQVQSADANQPLSAKSCEEFPRIPCATVLLRVTRAKLSGDGLALLSRKDFPSNEWAAKGLLALAPQYYEQTYDSIRCVPSGIEERIYSIRHKNRRQKTVSQCLQQVSLSISEARDKLKAKPLSYLDLTSALRYEPTIGFRVAVDTLHNVKTKGGPFFRVLFSVYPPGSFYQAIRLTGDVYFTTTTDWTSAQASPEFADGFMTFRDSPSDQSLVVLFDVRSVTRHPKTGAITSQQYGWTFLPVLAHGRSVHAGVAQLPLFQGEVNLEILKGTIGGLSTLIDDIANDKMKQLVPVAEEGASLFVRLQDPQLPHLSSQPMINASLSKMVPPRLSAKYTYDNIKNAALKKKAPLSRLLPANVPDKQFEKELNQAFAQEMGIHHLLF